MKNAAFFLFAGLLMFFGFRNGEYIVQGVVLDDVGMPLIGATVLESGTQNGTVTDIEGKFQIKMMDSKNKLLIQMTGYEQMVVTPEFKKILKVKMKPSMPLDEIVVTGVVAGGANKKIKHFSNAAYSTMPRPSQRPFIYRESGSPENYKHFNDNPFKKVTDEPLSTMSIDVDKASYSNVRRYLNSGAMPPVDAVRVEEMINYFNYQYEGPEVKSDDPLNIKTTYLGCPWNKDHTLLHMAMKAKELDRKKIPPSNFVFLIDVSGSMGAYNKLPLVIESFKLLINQLGENDVISIVTYAGSEKVVAKGVKGNEKEKLTEALMTLQAGGGTAGASGIMKAYEIGRQFFIEEGNNRVILATDGDFNIGISSEGDLVRLIEERRKTGIYFSVLGYGMGNYQENKMQELSQAGNGHHFYIDDIEEAKKSLIKEFGSTMYVVANDMKIQVEFNPEKVAGYRVIGYENRQLANEDFNDDTKDAGELGAGHTVTVIYEIIPKGVQSSFLREVDALKYSSAKGKTGSEDLATIKIRYKKDLKSSSVKREIPVKTKMTGADECNYHINWSIAMAEFGLLLRNSPYKGKASYTSLLSRAKPWANDEYRKEGLELMEKAWKMDKESVISEKSNK